MGKYNVKVKTATSIKGFSIIPIEEENIGRAQMRASLMFGSANVLNVSESEDKVVIPQKNYLITIVFVDSKESITINPKEEDLDRCIDHNLGGWINLNTASTSSNNLRKGNYQQAGTTKDGKKLFSILCF